MDAGAQPLRWIGRRTLTADDLAAHPRLAPVRIKAGALAPNVPMTDLLVLPQHRILVRSKVAERMFGTREVLIPANKLLALPGIDRVPDTTEVEYFHMLFDAHQLVWANGAVTESLFTGPETLKAVGARRNRDASP